MRLGYRERQAERRGELGRREQRRAAERAALVGSGTPGPATMSPLHVEANRPLGAYDGPTKPHKKRLRPGSTMAKIFAQACQLPQPFSTMALARKLGKTNINVLWALHRLEMKGYLVMIGNIETLTITKNGESTARWTLWWQATN